MRCLILIIPTLLLSIFAGAQKKNDKTGLDKFDAVLKADLQKNVTALQAIQTKENSIDFIAAAYKNIGLQPFADSINFLQPFTLDLGKEIKPTTNIKINGIQLEVGTDYWPFPFCRNSFFAGTAVWDAMEPNQPFLFDLKQVLENNKQITRIALVKTIKEKAAELAIKKASALIVYNGSEINDSLSFSNIDTTELITIPIIYFTKNGIQKLKNESTIANAIDAQILMGEKIANGTNVLAYLNNKADNTVVITTSINNKIGNVAIFEIAKLIKEISRPSKKNIVDTIAANYTNNNYLFITVDGLTQNNLGANYFLDHLPFDVSKINYAINIGINNSPIDTTGFLSILETNSSTSWQTILQKNNQSYISKTDSTLVYMLNSVPFYKKNIPNLFLFNPDFDVQQKNKSVNINKNDIKTIHYIFELIGNANKHGKLPFTMNDK